MFSIFFQNHFFIIYYNMNTKKWYYNPSFLMENPYQFVPKRNFSIEEKSNSLARFAIYFALFVILTGSNQKYLAISIIFILISIFLSETEEFSQIMDDKANEGSCVKPTIDNPFMNFTLKDYYNDPNRPKNCPIKKVRKEMRREFLKNVVPDPNDLFGQNISDRNFYTMPNTRIVNDQKAFANWCYESMGECKSSGKNCLKTGLSRTSLGAFQSI